MNEFDNVTLVKQANIYFDGGVTSRTVKFNDGSIRTLGIILPGEYEFNTDKKEHMEMLSGKVEILLAGEAAWNSYSAGDTFEVPANSSFKIKAGTIADYCCSFID